MKQFTDASIGLSKVNVTALNEVQNEQPANSTLNAIEDQKRNGLVGPTEAWVYRTMIQSMLESGALKLTD